MFSEIIKTLEKYNIYGITYRVEIDATSGLWIFAYLNGEPLGHTYYNRMTNDYHTFIKEGVEGINYELVKIVLLEVIKEIHR